MGYKSGGLTQKHGAWGAYDAYFPNNGDNVKPLNSKTHQCSLQETGDATSLQNSGYIYIYIYYMYIHAMPRKTYHLGSSCP